MNKIEVLSYFYTLKPLILLNFILYLIKEKEDNMKNNDWVAYAAIGLATIIGLIATQNANCLWALLFMLFI